MVRKKSVDQYRRNSLRLQHWDYGCDGGYFVTLCSHRHACCFGDIVDDRMVLSRLGVIADVLWHEIKHHAANVELAEFVVMPNHVHGVLVLGGDSAGPGLDAVGARHALPLQQSLSSSCQNPGQQRFQNQGRNTLSSIVGSYKSAVSKHAHRLGFEFGWQRNYWEHIIRNDDEYCRIAEYINNNPKSWQLDKLNGGSGNVVLEASPVYGEEDWMV